MNTPAYILPLSKAFQQHNNAINAEQMMAYMKGQYEYFGLKAPLRKELVQAHKSAYGLIPDEKKTEIVTWCWSQPQREYQYAAMDLLGRSAAKEKENILDLYQFMIVEKSWWDTVDFIASNLVGVYFQKFPNQIPARTSLWMDSGNMWLQRTCLLFQLKYKKTLNTDLLASFIAPLAGSGEFFIRKAIGWILREYSKTDPGYVTDFVAKNKLSGLSEREAMRIINKH